MTLDEDALTKLESDLDHGDELHTLVGFETYGDNVTVLGRALIAELRASRKVVEAAHDLARRAYLRGIDTKALDAALAEYEALK